MYVKERGENGRGKGRVGSDRLKNRWESIVRAQIFEQGNRLKDEKEGIKNRIVSAEVISGSHNLLRMNRLINR